MGEITFDKEMEVGQWHSETPDYSAAYNQWQPIETAPKDGTEILATNGEESTTVHWLSLLGYWNLCVWGSGDDHGDFKPTHWMPLPPPPSKPIG